MTAFRGIPLSVHAAVETLAGPLIIAGPFAFGFGQTATVISVIVGALLLGLALQLPGPQRSIPLRTHAQFDYALAAFATAAGIAIGIGSGVWAPTVFLAGIGAAMVVLTASTRFSVPRGA